MTWIQADFVVLERPSPHTMTGIVMIWFQLMQNHEVKWNVAITIRFKLLGCIDWIWRRRTRRPFCWHILKYWDGQYIFASNPTAIWVFHGGHIQCSGTLMDLGVSAHVRGSRRIQAANITTCMRFSSPVRGRTYPDSAYPQTYRPKIHC